MFSNSFWQARAAATGMVLALTAGLVGLLASPVHAQSTSRTNIATVAAPAGTTDTNPGNNTGTATVTLGPTAAAYSFCAVPHGSATSNAVYGIVNGVQIARYEPGAGADAAVPELALPTVGGDVNALMIDPARDRLLFHAGSSSQLWAYDADNGGWYVAATGVTGNFPRGGMTAAGVGYLMEGGASPAVRRIDPSGTYGYTVTNIGNVTYDIAPVGSNTSGDIAFDANGDAWLLVGRDLYLVDMATLQAVRQARPLIGGAVPTIDFAGIAFADDGSLYLANNAGGSGSAYYRYDFATGALIQTATTAASASRDLASCAFPTPAAADLSVAKTLAQVNGATYAGGPVSAGDTLTYAITISNAGAAVGTLYPNDVVETVPANTTYVATGNTFSAVAVPGPGYTLGSAVNVPAGGNAVLNFVVQVNDPVPANVTSIANAVTFPNDTIDCTATGNDCEEITPLGPTTSVAKTSNPATGAAVSSGDTIGYTLTVTVANAATTEAITLTDTLGAGLTLSGALPAGCTAAGQVVTCVLAAPAAVGTHLFNYSATVDASATGTVGNVVVPTTPPGGDPDPTCTTCTTEHPLTPATSVAKTSNPATGATVSPGDTIGYTLTMTVANAATTEAITLTDTLGNGLTLSGALPAGCTASGQVVTCVLAAGAAIGTHLFNYSATVDADATGTVGNVVVPTTPPGGDPDPTCTTCTTTHSLTPITTVSKTSNPATGTAVSPGDTIGYTLTVAVANAPTTEAITLTDTLGNGLTLAGALPAGCTSSGQVVTCVLAAGAAIGTHAFNYNATVDADANGSVGNVVVPTTPPGGDPDPTCTTCTTEHPLTPATSVAKASNPANGAAVAAGQTIAYTLTVTVANAATTEAITLTDTLGNGLTLAGALPAGCTSSGQVVTCVLAAPAAIGTHVFNYNATVDADASGTVGNVVVPTTPPGGDPDPTCTTCTTEHPLTPATSVAKTSNPANGAAVVAGQTIGYTLTVTVANAATTEAITLTDTLGTGLTLSGALPAGCSAAGQVVTCVLAAGATMGTHVFNYNATVDADATGTVGNVVVPTTPPGGDPDPTCTTCTTEHPLLPVTSVTKTSNPASGTSVSPGNTIGYTLTVTVVNAATSEAITLTDTLGAGLTLSGALPAGCSAAGQVVTCVLAAGATVGTHAFNYSATVDADASGSVGNVVVPTTPPGGDPDPTCTTCTTEHPLTPATSVAKTSNPASGSSVSPGDTLGYTLTVTVANAATTEAITLTDTLGTGLTLSGALPAGCTASGQVVTCVLAAGAAIGTHAFNYNATVDANATGSVGNVVVPTTPPGGDPDPTCTTCTTEHPLTPATSVAKTSNPATGATVNPGDTIGYTLTVAVANAATTEAITLTDTLGNGLTLSGALPAGCTASGQVVTCVLAAGAAIGTHLFNYSATVDADATGTVGNVVVPTTPPGGDPDPTCTTCTTEHIVEPPSIMVVKSANPASGSEVSPGDTVTYTLTATVANSATTEVMTLTDTLGAGLTFGAVTNAGVFACTGALTCTLPAGTLPGTYAVSYTATVDANATGTLRNAVTATNPPGGDPDPTCTTCTTEHIVEPPSIMVVKSANPASGSEVSPGDTVTYTLTATVANSATTEVMTLTDTLGAGLTFGAVTNAGVFACTGALTCTLPAGTLPGSYAVSYTATVDANATGTLRNAVTATNPPGGDPDPTCTTCTTEHEIVAPVIDVAKSANPAPGTEVRVGDTIAYTLTVTVARSATIDTLTLVDTLGAGLSFGAVTNAGAFACTGSLTCTLPGGTLQGTYAITYTATVDPGATRIVSNVVTATGGTGTSGQPPSCGSCGTEHPLAAPRVLVAKGATPGTGAQVNIGDTIDYTLTVTIENSATLAEVRLVDTPGPGLALGTMPAGCMAQGATAVCTLPAGTLPGVYTFTYPATVTADAGEHVRNVVVGSGGGGDPPECTSCETEHEVVDDAQLRIVKTVGARNVKVGDLVRYTLTVENVGTANVTNATVVDTPPAGFTYVEGSMSVADRDGAFSLEGQYPLRIGGLDINVGGQATIVYLLRVGAGVKPGVHINEAVAVDDSGDPISNVATAQVVLDSDPLLDDSLVFGTVFDDRDGDSWQDRADLGEVRVQGGFAPGAYLAGSTTIDRGNGPQPLADASAPLLHGIDVGAIAARQSEGDPVEAHRVAIRQRLHSLDFADDFVLTSAQGVTVRMDAAGNTKVERTGEAAKGLTAAEPTVERTVSAVDGGFEVAYVISNHGIDERGIPGVRIASVEGLLIETDQYGRYHLADVQGGDWGHGRNFLLKVDPATLPPGTVFTTENPRVRRVTPGIPVRFDFGVKLPVQVLEGGERKVDLELGEVIFAPGSAEVREAYLPAIGLISEKIDEYRGGEVVITADGDNEALAFARAAAVRDAVTAHVNATAQAGLSVVLRTRVGDPHSLVAGVDAGGALLGTVLFDTDKSNIRPEFEGLLDAVAKRLEALGGGVVGIVGHTDVRASHAYNTALGLRRATAVQQALAKRLSQEVRARVRVEASSDPAAPVGTERE